METALTLGQEYVLSSEDYAINPIRVVVIRLLHTETDFPVALLKVYGTLSFGDQQYTHLVIGARSADEDLEHILRWPVSVNIGGVREGTTVSEPFTTDSVDFFAIGHLDVSRP